MSGRVPRAALTVSKRFWMGFRARMEMFLSTLKKALLQRSGKRLELICP